MVPPPQPSDTSGMPRSAWIRSAANTTTYPPAAASVRRTRAALAPPAQHDQRDDRQQLHRVQADEVRHAQVAVLPCSIR